MGTTEVLHAVTKRKKSLLVPEIEPGSSMQYSSHNTELLLLNQARLMHSFVSLSITYSSTYKKGVASTNLRTSTNLSISSSQWVVTHHEGRKGISEMSAKAYSLHFHGAVSHKQEFYHP
jgi:hypothetical protein